MNRLIYFPYIEKELNTLSKRIETNGKLNILTIHNHSENFFQHFFNVLYDYSLEDSNDSLQNTEAIDLVDNTNKIVVQVSATNTKEKVESALSKNLIKRYKEYRFKFISIAKNASNLRSKSYKNPHNIKFDPASDIYDIVSILSYVKGRDIDKQEEVYEFIKKELGKQIDFTRIESNLAAIINILAEESLDQINVDETVDSFEIERKVNHNNLINSKFVIDEYKVFYIKVDNIYSEYDKLGNNKSNSVLASLKRIYLKLKGKEDSDSIFESITDKVRDKIIISANFIQIPIDELDLCIDIIVVDAFIRCKIFENPEKYNYVTS